MFKKVECFTRQHFFVISASLLQNAGPAAGVNRKMDRQSE